MTATKVSAKDKTKEWTLMFYFASDNPLAPSVVSQLKALKNAGFHPDANVVAHFDPHTLGTPDHTFNINLVPKLKALAKPEALKKLEESAEGELRDKLAAAQARHGGPDKLKTHQVGFPANDPYIRNLVLDKLWGNATIPDGADGKKSIRDLIEATIKDDVRCFLTDRINGDESDGTVDRRPSEVATDGAPFQDEIKSVIETADLIVYNPLDPDAFDPSAGKQDGAKTEEASGGDNGKAAATPGEFGTEDAPKDPTNADGKTLQVDKDYPRKALDRFLQFCANEYPAQRYMLFILGHGLIVGNDMFLFDEHAKRPTLSLIDLDEVLDDFGVAITKDDPKRELSLLAFHACSMSSIEVAYQLQGKAKYMMASQGPEFVGSLPYTQILVRVFNDLVHGKNNVEETVNDIFSYCFYNSLDFQMAGYSFDLALCDLDKASNMMSPIKNLVKELMDALGDDDGKGGNEFIKALILLAHWDAQSVWRDTYTDLYDFCLRLYIRCERATDYASDDTKKKLKVIQDYCVELMKALRGEGGLVLQSSFAGPSYQYSHGLSVFFPWSQPSNEDFWPPEGADDTAKKTVTDGKSEEGSKSYKDYKFEATGWREFLQRFFNNTMRDTRGDEDMLDPMLATNSVVAKPGVEGGNQSYRGKKKNNEESAKLEFDLLEAITAHIFERGEVGQLGPGKAGGGDALKGGGSDTIGEDCDCPPIKNYPSITRASRKNKKEKVVEEDGGGGPYEGVTYLILPE